MALVDGMLRELEEEAVTTRRVPERVPDNGWCGWGHVRAIKRPTLMSRAAR